MRLNGWVWGTVVMRKTSISWLIRSRFGIPWLTRMSGLIFEWIQKHIANQEYVYFHWKKWTSLSLMPISSTNSELSLRTNIATTNKIQKFCFKLQWNAFVCKFLFTLEINWVVNQIIRSIAQPNIWFWLIFLFWDWIKSQRKNEEYVQHKLQIYFHLIMFALAITNFFFSWSEP